MAAKFTEEEDYRYIHKLAQEANGEEKKRRKELVDFREKRQAEKTARKEIQEKMLRQLLPELQNWILFLTKKKFQVSKARPLRTN